MTAHAGYMKAGVDLQRMNYDTIRCVCVCVGGGGGISDGWGVWGGEGARYDCSCRVHESWTRSPAYELLSAQADRGRIAR